MDPDQEYGTRSRKLLDTDPVRIRIHNTREDDRDKCGKREKEKKSKREKEKKRKREKEKKRKKEGERITGKKIYLTKIFIDSDIH